MFFAEKKNANVWFVKDQIYRIIVIFGDILSCDAFTYLFYDDIRKDDDYNINGDWRPKIFDFLVVKKSTSRPQFQTCVVHAAGFIHYQAIFQ